VKTKILFFFFYFFLLTPFVQGMLSDGIHQPKDYLDFVQTQEAFRASCYVFDHRRHILQSGVLISPDIIMTAAHGFEGKVHLDSIIVGFGESVTLTSEQNYKVKAMRTHPRYFTTEFPMQVKYDLAFMKLTTPVKGIKPVPLFEEKVFDPIPPLYVATFGSADIPHGVPVNRRAFVLPEADVFTIMGRDPEALYDYKTVMMGSIFFEPNDHLKPVPTYADEQKVRTYFANKQWQKLNKPPYALVLPGSSGAPVFMNVEENGLPKTYVFGIIQSFSHLSSTSFKHASGPKETRRILKKKYHKIYGRYQSIFCVPYKLYMPLQAYKSTTKTYRISRHVKNILMDLEKIGTSVTNPTESRSRKEKSLHKH